MTPLSRRTALTLGGCALAAPALARPAATLRFVPSADLSSIDPIWTTADMVRNHGYLVYDTLYATDLSYRVRPQMARGHDISDDGLTWTIRLREGLTWHDGTPVLARDCMASIRRWASRDGFGQALMAVTDEVRAVDDTTLRFRLRSPFPLLAEALGKLSAPVPFMMPERIARIDASQQIQDATGSGPFRFLAEAWVQGSHAAYAKFDRYLPRAEPPDNAAGGKVARVSRVEWHIMPDSTDAVSALRAGQVDWVEQPRADLLPLIARSPNLVVTALDPLGSCALLRFNALYPPFDDVLARRAVLAAVDQTDYLQAIGHDAATAQVCKAFFPCGTPLSTGAGSAAMAGSIDRAKQLLRDSRYDGRKVVVLLPTDQPPLAALGHVTADLLQRMGMAVDLVEADWASVLTRSTSQKPPADGGWNIVPLIGIAAEFMNPAVHPALRGHGPSGWAGWVSDPALDHLRRQWLGTADAAARQAVAGEIERQAFASVPYVPLGQFHTATAYRSALHGVLKATAPFAWNLSKG